MKITVAKEGILRQKADGVVLGVPEGGGKAKALTVLTKQFRGELRTVVEKGLPKSRSSLTVPLETGKFKYAVLVKAKKERPDADELHGMLSRAVNELESVGCSSAVVDLASLARDRDADGWSVRLASQAVGSACYRFSLGKRLATKEISSVALVSKDKGSASAKAARIGSAIGEGMRVAKHLGEQPPNLLYPDELGREARKLCSAVGLKVTVHDDKSLAKLKMNGLLTVGKGSARKPRLIVIKHMKGPAGGRPIALVGKGITFDTGGNSLKPGAHMMDMKFDMCGAAGVIGTLIACARMRMPLNVVGVIPSAENMVASDSYRPDDIIKMMDGQTVEVLNTDAEGRIILGDALTYAQKYVKPRMIIDAATLTGACLVALGQHRCGMFANEDSLADGLFEAGEESGDLCWRLPLDDSYDRMLSSKIADMQNIGGGGKAGTITAACFLRRFVKGTDWAHLDIAGSAWQERRASGRPVPLLSTFLARKARMIK